MTESRDRAGNDASQSVGCQAENSAVMGNGNVKATVQMSMNAKLHNATMAPTINCLFINPQTADDSIIPQTPQGADFPWNCATESVHRYIEITVSTLGEYTFSHSIRWQQHTVIRWHTDNATARGMIHTYVKQVKADIEPGMTPVSELLRRLRKLSYNRHDQYFKNLNEQTQ